MRMYTQLLVLLLSSSLLHADVQSLSQENFTQQVLSSKGGAVVKVFAPWCAPCTRMAPIFYALSTQFTKVAFFEMNRDSNQWVAERYRLQFIPSFLFFYDGKFVAKQVGSLPKEDLAELIKALVCK